MSESVNQVEEENLDRNAAATLATPLRQYVTMIGGKREKWTCNFKCKLEPYTGSYSRIRAHLIGLMPGQKAQGISLCSNVSQEDIARMKSEEKEAKLLYGKKSPVPSLPMVTPMNKAGSTSAQVKSIADLFNTYSRNDLDDLIGRFFYGCGIPFNVARSPFFVDMVRGINDGPKGYKAPSSEKIRTVLLDKEKSKLECALMGLKDQWPLFGVSIVSDGWSNIKNQPLVNVLAISGGRAMFLQGIDCSGNEKTGAFIAEILLKAIENVGVYNVVQVLTDNTSACKLAGELIMQRYPHIFWSGCMAHTLSLLMKDIANSDHPSLLFYDMNGRKLREL